MVVADLVWVAEAWVEVVCMVVADLLWVVEVWVEAIPAISLPLHRQEAWDLLPATYLAATEKEEQQLLA